MFVLQNLPEVVDHIYADIRELVFVEVRNEVLASPEFVASHIALLDSSVRLCPCRSSGKDIRTGIPMPSGGGEFL